METVKFVIMCLLLLFVLNYGLNIKKFINDIKKYIKSEREKIMSTNYITDNPVSLSKILEESKLIKIHDPIDWSENDYQWFNDNGNKIITDGKNYLWLGFYINTDLISVITRYNSNNPDPMLEEIAIIGKTEIYSEHDDEYLEMQIREIH